MITPPELTHLALNFVSSHGGLTAAFLCGAAALDMATKALKFWKELRPPKPLDPPEPPKPEGKTSPEGD